MVTDRKIAQFYPTLRQTITSSYDEDRHWVAGPERAPLVTELPPEDPAVFMKKLEKSPDLEQALCRETISGLIHTQRQKWQVHGYTLFPHQRADLSFAATALATGNRRQYAKILFRNPGGTGKTLQLGFMNEKFVNMQIRQILSGEEPGVGAFCAARPTSMGQQAFSREQQALRSPPHSLERRHINRFARDCKKLWGDEFTEIFGKGWAQLFDEEYTADRNGMRAITEVLADRKDNPLQKIEAMGWDNPMVQAVIGLIQGDKITIKGRHNTPVFVSPPPFGDVTIDSYGGDATYGLPKGYPVLAGKPKWQLDQLPEGVEPQFFLTTASTFTSRSSQEKFASLLRRMQFVTLDEMRSSNPDTYCGAVTDAGARRDPIFIANSATYKGNRPNIVHSGRKSVAEFIDEGVFGNIGYDCYPSADAEFGEAGDDWGDVDDYLYSQGTEEAYMQFENAYFRDEKLLDDLDLPQKYLVDTIVIAPSGKGVREYADRLQEAYDYYGIEVEDEVFCYDPTAGDDDRESLELWFSKKSDKPKVMVAPPSLMKDTVDLRNIKRVVIAAKLNEEQEKGVFERLTHSNVHLMGDADYEGEEPFEDVYRGYFEQQQFVGSRPPLIRTIDHGLELDETGLKWPRLQCLMNHEAYERDQERLKPRHRKEVVLIEDVDAPRRKAGSGEVIGTPMEWKSEFVVERERLRLERLRLKQEAEEQELFRSMQAQSAPVVSAETVRKQVAQIDLRTAPWPEVVNALLQQVQQNGLPRFMAENWQTWRGVLADVANKYKGYPDRALWEMQQRVERAANFGQAKDL